MLHAKLRNRTCQGLDYQGQGQGQGPSLQGPGQGLDLQGQGQGLKFGPQGVLKDKDKTRINITAVFRSGISRILSAVEVGSVTRLLFLERMVQEAMLIHGFVLIVYFTVCCHLAY